MAQLPQIPIRFRFMKVPAEWEIRTVSGNADNKPQEFAFSKVLDDGSFDAFKLSRLDGWKCREEFFGIPDGDNEGLSSFLSKVGVWHQMKGKLEAHWSKEVMQHYKQGHPAPISVADLWQFRDALKGALLDKNRFKETYAASLPWPETGFELAMEQSDTGSFPLSFPLRFELAGIAAGVVTTSEARRMLLATVFVDIASGIRFKVCKRKDCDRERIFPVETEHDQVYCCQHCGHLESVRRTRRKAKEEKRREARKTKRG